MRDSSNNPRREQTGARPHATADDRSTNKGYGHEAPPGPEDAIQVVKRKCTICDWEAQLVERGLGEDPLCPWCYGRTERASVVGLVVPGEVEPGGKNPYAASLGRLGGLKGGPARAAKLTAKQRREIASKAARARWAKKHKPAGDRRK